MVLTTVKVLLPLLLLSIVQLSVQYSPGEVCQGFRSRWITSYAPGNGQDVNFTHFQSVATGVNPLPIAPTPTGCRAGGVQQTPFLDDALRRLNYYRWLVDLPPASIDTVHQQASQECALMMALNNNTDSPWQTSTQDAHTDHTNWKCRTVSGSDAARWGNIYAGQSVPDPGFSFQTTPAHVLRGFVDDFSSSKQGHRQNILCPNLDDVAFGHLCFYDASNTNRYFCGGCQWAYGRNSAAMPVSGFVAWPPAGPVPDQIVPIHPFFWWSFAAFMGSPAITPVVRMNGQQVNAQMVLPLCRGEGIAGNNDPNGPRLTWLRFQPPNFSIGDVLRVEVTSGTSFYWSYQVQLVNCDNIPDPATPRPSPVPSPVPSNPPSPVPSIPPSPVPSDAPTGQANTSISSTTNYPSTTPTTPNIPTTLPTEVAEISGIVLTMMSVVCLIGLGVMGLCYYYRYKIVAPAPRAVSRNLVPLEPFHLSYIDEDEAIARLDRQRGTVLLMTDN